MKYITTYIILGLIPLIFPQFIYGQTFDILNYSLLYSDLSAQTEPREDFNGVKCGLIKVRCVLDGVSFKGNVIGNVEHIDGEYWVYMSSGSKKLSIHHAKLLPLDVDFESIFNETIQPATTYLLTLSIPDVLYSTTLKNYEITSSQNIVKQNMLDENNTTISGIVTGTDDGEPIIGCTVMVKDTYNAIVTDIDGNFTLNNVIPNSTIKCSYIGYKTKEITFIGNIPPMLNVSLRPGKGTDREDYFYDPNDTSDYFDLNGNALSSRPTKKGTYLKVTNGKPEKLIIK
jgi:hypothetical protein